MEDFFHRLVKLIDNENITITKLESIIGASKGVLSRAMNNRTDIQMKWVQKIVENYPMYNPGWLLTGEGEVLKSCNVQVVSDNKSENELILLLRNQIASLKRESELKDIIIEEKERYIQDLLSRFNGNFLQKTGTE